MPWKLPESPTPHALLIVAASGFTDTTGTQLRVGLCSGLAITYAIGLAAGAMIFVVSHAVIPETHRNGQQSPATLGLSSACAIMMLLDTALG